MKISIFTRNLFIILGVILLILHLGRLLVTSWSHVHYCSSELRHFSAPITNTSTLSCGEPCQTRDTRPELVEFSKILQSYRTFHRSSREAMLATGESVRSLTWYCIDTCGGGIGDHMKGIYAAFLLAVATNRTFFIYRSDENRIAEPMEPHRIDWRPISSCIRIIHSDQILSSGRTDKSTYSSVIDRLNTTQHIYVSGNRHITPLIQSMNYSITAKENEALLEILLTLSSQMSSFHCLLSMTHQFLFQVPQSVTANANSSLTQLNLQPQKYVSVHIRTGFMSHYFTDVLTTKEYIMGNRFASSADSWKQMLDCAVGIANHFLGVESKIFVVSDDQQPKQWAKEAYGSRVATLDVHPIHINYPHLTNDGNINQSYYSNWLELSVMAQSYALVMIPSGFSDTAAHMCSISPANIYIYSIAEKWCRVLVKVSQSLM